MKVLHIIEDFSLNSGGLRTVVKNLDFYLKSAGEESYIISSNKEKEDDIKTVYSDNAWMYNKTWKNEILDSIQKNKIDIVHIHGVWMYPQFIGAKTCIQKKIPFIVTPHGMYEPWLWNNGSVKKKVYFNLLAYKMFSKAKYIHGITNEEIVNLKSLFKNNKFTEIPNLISIKQNNRVSDFSSKYILYLGRLDSIKGIENLLISFEKIRDLNFTLKIAGGFNEYKQVLEKIIIDLNIEKRVTFLGLIKGEQKTKIIQNAWVLVAPSFSEVIGMVNLEAASLKTPVITTYQTGIKVEWNKNGGILINPNSNELTKALKSVVLWSKEERIKNGEKLFRFVEKKYSWERNLNKWIDLYRNTINS